MRVKYYLKLYAMQTPRVGLPIVMCTHVYVVCTIFFFYFIFASPTEKLSLAFFFWLIVINHHPKVQGPRSFFFFLLPQLNLWQIINPRTGTDIIIFAN